MRLQNKETGQEWAGPDRPLGLVEYQALGQLDYDRYVNQYLRELYLDGADNWAIGDFTKPGLKDFHMKGERWSAELDRLHHLGGDKPGVIAELHFAEKAVTTFGAPRYLTLEIVELPCGFGIDMTLQWFEKQATRIPEAVWFSLMPNISDFWRWTVDKIGTQISTRDIVSHGGRQLHAIGTGATCTRHNELIKVRSLDAPLAAFGKPEIIDFDDRIASPTEGIHFNLFNNVWGTNFRMWFEDDARFRFNLRFNPEQPPA